MAELEIIPIKKSDPFLLSLMKIHYSQPKGFVGRQIFYSIEFEKISYGCIAFGSTTLHLPGRKEFLSYLPEIDLKTGMNNIFYHIEKKNGQYPLRNFTTKALLLAEKRSIMDWQSRYGSPVYWIETLVEPPRTGELYLKAGYNQIGTTKGFTCKRHPGKGTDSWGGQRVWDYNNLRPKNVYIKRIDDASISNKG